MSVEIAALQETISGEQEEEASGSRLGFLVSDLLAGRLINIYLDQENR